MVITSDGRQTRTGLLSLGGLGELGARQVFSMPESQIVSPILA